MLYQITYQFIERETTSTKFCSILGHKIHSIYDENGRTFKIVLAKLWY